MSQDALTQFVQTLFSSMGIQPSSLVVSSGHRTVVAVALDDASAFLNNNGEALRALNALARRIVEKAHGEEAANFLIDINGHHEQQMEAVRANARMLAQRARLFKHEVEMEPMSSYERLVVHELFAEDPEIETRSEGEGKFRHIVLAFRGAK